MLQGDPIFAVCSECAPHARTRSTKKIPKMILDPSSPTNCERLRLAWLRSPAQPGLRRGALARDVEVHLHTSAKTATIDGTHPSDGQFTIII